MKKLTLVIVLFSVAITNAQIVNIPDSNFKAVLLAAGVDMNGDGEIQMSEAEATYSIVADSSNISDLTGIEAFINLSQLYVSLNNLTTIDVSNNMNLEKLIVEFNQLESLDVSNNVQLSWLWFSGNNISEIDLTNNPNIQILWASNNELKGIDVSKILGLASLNLGNNQLSAIDVSNNPNLSHFDLTAGNMVTELDLSNNPLLCSVVVGSNNLLEYVNLRNGANPLLVEGSTCYFGSGNSNSILLANNNPILEIICVDDVTFAEANFQHIPTQTVFVDDCFLGINDFQSSLISLYPNPVTDDLTIASDMELSSVEILSALGQTVKENQVSSTQTTVSLSGLSNGIYFVKVTAGTTSQVMQIIKK